MASKDGRFYLRLSDEDRQLFDEVAEALGSETTSHAIRFIMRQKHRELYGTMPAVKRQQKRKR